MTRARRVAFITPNFENNSLGRTYCLWMLARSLGWSTVVTGVRGQQVWAPLADSEFASDILIPQREQLGRTVDEALQSADVIVAVKPLPSSLGVALRRARQLPVVLDMDDPDIEVRTSWLPARKRILTALRRPQRYRELLSYREVASRLPLMVSNPELQRMHGGVVVPHVRAIGPSGGHSDTDRPIVRFVGSPRGHKGVDVLRTAVALLADDGFRLEVTAEAPSDAKPWESWVGPTSLAEGEERVRTADIVAIPSLDYDWAGAQLPAKLIDAMAQGRATIASSLAPMTWALGDTGLLVPPRDVPALAAALRKLADPDLRASLGSAARHRAETMFSVDAVAPTFAKVIEEAIGGKCQERGAR